MFAWSVNVSHRVDDCVEASPVCGLGVQRRSAAQPSTLFRSLTTTFSLCFLGPRMHISHFSKVFLNPIPPIQRTLFTPSPGTRKIPQEKHTGISPIHHSPRHLFFLRGSTKRRRYGYRAARELLPLFRRGVLPLQKGSCRLDRPCTQPSQIWRPFEDAGLGGEVGHETGE